MRSKRERGDVYGLDADGMSLCNARDREADHRAQVARVPTEDVAAVTCGKCRKLTYRDRREARGCGR